MFLPAYTEIYTHNLLRSTVKCVNLCFKTNVRMCLHTQHDSESPLALAQGAWPKVQLKIAFSLSLAAFEHMHLCAGNTQCDPASLKLNLNSNVYRFLKYCLPLRFESCRYSINTFLTCGCMLLKVCFYPPNYIAKKRHSCIDANKCRCTAAPQTDTAASPLSTFLNSS